MTKEEIHQPRKNGDTVGRTLWDMVEKYQLLVITIAVFAIPILSFLSWNIYKNTPPGKPVQLFGITVMVKSEPDPMPIDQVIVGETVEDLRIKNEVMEKPQPDPMSIVDDQVLVGETVEDLRIKNEVSELRPLQNGLELSKLPAGIYGFEVPWKIRVESTGIGFERFTLSIKQDEVSAMEIHKSGDSGRIYVIGYLAETSLTNLQNPSRIEPIDVILSFKPYSDWIPIAVPAQHILSSSHRTISDDNVTNLDISDMKLR